MDRPIENPRKRMISDKIPKETPKNYQEKTATLTPTRLLPRVNRLQDDKKICYLISIVLKNPEEVCLRVYQKTKKNYRYCVRYEDAKKFA